LRAFYLTKSKKIPFEGGKERALRYVMIPTQQMRR
jgi:hypothetical protein